MILLLLLGSLSALANPYIEYCGTYEATGRAICKGAACEFVVWEKSQAETRFKPVPGVQKHAPGFPGFTVATLEVHSLNSLPYPATVTAMRPLAGTPSMGAQDLKLIQKKACDKK